MATFGNITNTPVLASFGVVSGGLMMSKFTLAANGYVTRLTVRVLSAATNPSYMYGFIYADNAGYPGTSRGKTLRTDNIQSGSNQARNLDFATPVFLVAGDYWIGVTPSDNLVSVSWQDNAPDLSYVQASDTGAYSDLLPDPAPLGMDDVLSSYQLMIYAEYTPATLWNTPLKTTENYLGNKAGIAGLTKQQALNKLAGAGINEGMSKQDAANIYAGTTGLTTAAALSYKAGTAANVDIDGQEAARRL